MPALVGLMSCLKKLYACSPKGAHKARIKLFKIGNSQAVRIPAELAYRTWDLDLVIERQGDEFRIRPAQRRMGDVLGKNSEDERKA